jgi:hypothetical protein
MFHMPIVSLLMLVAGEAGTASQWLWTGVTQTGEAMSLALWGLTLMTASWTFKRFRKRHPAAAVPGVEPAPRGVEKVRRASSRGRRNTWPVPVAAAGSIRRRERGAGRHERWPLV